MYQNTKCISDVCYCVVCISEEPSDDETKRGIEIPDKRRRSRVIYMLSVEEASRSASLLNLDSSALQLPWLFF